MTMRKKFGPLKKINKANLRRLPSNPGVYGIFTDSGIIQELARAKRHRADKRIVESQNEIREPKRQA